MWWLYAVIGSFFLAGYVYSNQLFKLSAPILMMYRGFGVAFVLFPLALFMSPLFGWQFYVLTAIQGLFIGFIDLRYFRSSKIFGGEVTGITQPLSLGITFLSWFIIKPDKLFELLSSPLICIIVILSLLGISFSIYALKKGKANKKALLYLLPCIVIGGILDTNNKVIMSYGVAAPLVAVYFYTMFSALFTGIYSFRSYIKKKQKIVDLFKKEYIKKGFFVMFFLIGLVFFKGYAISQSPNPAYVVAITYLAPLWMSFANNIKDRYSAKKVKNRINIKIITLMLLSVVSLILATR